MSAFVYRVLDLSAEVHRYIALSGSNGISLADLISGLSVPFKDARIIKRILIEKKSLYETVYSTAWKTKVGK